LQRTYLKKVEVLEKEILQENVECLANNIIISKTFSDEIRMENRKNAKRLVDFHKERFLN